MVNLVAVIKHTFDRKWKETVLPEQFKSIYEHPQTKISGLNFNTSLEKRHRVRRDQVIGFINDNNCVLSYDSRTPKLQSYTTATAG